MSEYCREQHPLLCEEVSEEESYSPRYYRRIRPINYRGRTKNNLKGAAAILTRWSDHWTSFLTYWWIGIAMISLSTFIIYNCLFAFSIIPSANMKPTRLIVINGNEKTSIRSSPLPEVYMHVLVGQNEDINLNQYIPYIEIIANTFTEFNFHLIVLINDTNVGWMSAEQNNELALNKLWIKDKKAFEKEPHSYNINMEHLTLSTYMDNSPLKKYWRTLPCQLIEFVARTLSIWDKGGVTFNPDILTPKFQDTIYIKKLQKILNKYAHTNKVINDSKFIKKQNKDPEKYRKLNNIRDIIEALEMEDISANAFSQQTLSEAENKDMQLIRHGRQVSTVTESIDGNATVTNVEALNTITEMDPYNISSTKYTEYNAIVNSTESTYSSNNKHNSTKMSLLPLFLEYLFHSNANIKPKITEVTLSNRTRKSAILTPDRKANGSLSKNNLLQVEKETKHVYQPLVVSAAGIYNKSKYNIDDNESLDKEENFEANRLIIDLKGNIIATDTPCHAFLGTIFSNVVHHSEEESVTDLIIAELTIFCKGLLSSCMGIDLILL